MNHHHDSRTKQKQRSVLQMGYHYCSSYGQFKSMSSKLVLIAAMSLALLATVTLYYPSLLITDSPLLSSTRKIITTGNNYSSNNNPEKSTMCDLFRGEWVPYNEGPYYTNETCGAIPDHQNCMKNGRPDTGYLKWRWKPDDCELPVFDSAEFLDLVRDKSLAFVGDSIASNHMQSLICLLSRIEHPIDVSYSPNGQFKRWKFVGHNFTVASFWAPFLVKSREYSNPSGLLSLYLDEFDQDWTTQIDDFHYIILSAGQSFYRPTVFYERRQVTGCHGCSLPNVTELGLSYGLRRALRTAFRAINRLGGYEGTTFLRTFAPSHYENGQWDKGGACVRTRPFGSNESSMEGHVVDIHASQVDELLAAEREGRARGRKFRLLDTTRVAFLRPDGHPSRYGRLAAKDGTFYNDCVHWCLPGPIDTWNDFLLQILKADRLNN